MVLCWPLRGMLHSVLVVLASGVVLYALGGPGWAWGLAFGLAVAFVAIEACFLWMRPIAARARARRDPRQQVAIDEWKLEFGWGNSTTLSVHWPLVRDV